MATELRKTARIGAVGSALGQRRPNAARDDRVLSKRNALSVTKRRTDGTYSAVADPVRGLPWPLLRPLRAVLPSPIPILGSLGAKGHEMPVSGSVCSSTGTCLTCNQPPWVGCGP